MSDQRDGGIAWTDQTWNPTRGCSRVSEGCRNCYAESVARRFSGPGMPYEGLVRLDASGKGKAQWNGAIRFVPERLADPLRWTRPRRVFVNSMSDLFHEAIDFEAIAAVFGVMTSAERHTFQVLTKRPERAREFFRWAESFDAGARAHCLLAALQAEIDEAAPLHRKHCADPVGPWPPTNVWIGVSVEDQATADERIPVLLTLPAAVRFVSYEPALGPVRFDRLGGDEELGTTYDALRGIWSGNDTPGPRLDWIIIGGESGSGARPFDLAWAARTVRACQDAAVSVFVKQIGARPVATDPDDANNPDEPVPFFRNSHRQIHSHGADPAEWPEYLRVREFPR